MSERMRLAESVVIDQTTAAFTTAAFARATPASITVRILFASIIQCCRAEVATEQSFIVHIREPESFVMDCYAPDQHILPLRPTADAVALRGVVALLVTHDVDRSRSWAVDANHGHIPWFHRRSAVYSIASFTGDHHRGPINAKPLVPAEDTPPTSVVRPSAASKNKLQARVERDDVNNRHHRTRPFGTRHEQTFPPPWKRLSPSHRIVDRRVGQ